MKLNINGKITDLQERLPLNQLLEELSIEVDRPGLAIAVNDEVLSRAEWGERVLNDGDRIEIIQAVQGG